MAVLAESQPCPQEHHAATMKQWNCETAKRATAVRGYAARSRTSTPNWHLQSSDWTRVINGPLTPLSSSRDGTERLERLGGNAVLAVSIANLIAAADAERLPLYELLADGRAPRLPLPMVNVLSGGAHAGGLVDVQDFLVIPVGAASFCRGDRVGEPCARRNGCRGESSEG